MAVCVCFNELELRVCALLRAPLAPPPLPPALPEKQTKETPQLHNTHMSCLKLHTHTRERRCVLLAKRRTRTRRTNVRTPENRFHIGERARERTHGPRFCACVCACCRSLREIGARTFFFLHDLVRCVNLVLYSLWCEPGVFGRQEQQQQKHIRPRVAAVLTVAREKTKLTHQRRSGQTSFCRLCVSAARA